MRTETRARNSPRINRIPPRIVLSLEVDKIPIEKAKTILEGFTAILEGYGKIGMKKSGASAPLAVFLPCFPLLKPNFPIVEVYSRYCPVKCI